MMKIDCPIFEVPIFDKDYHYKIQLLGLFIVENATKESNLKATNIYLKSHGNYYCIKADLLRYTKKSSDKLTISIDIQDEFGYFRCPKDVIIYNDKEIKFQSIGYNIFPNKPEIIFNFIDIRSVDNIKINSNIINIELIKGNGYLHIDLCKSIEGDRNKFINTFFSGEEKDDIMKILIDNDEFQENSYKNMKGAYDEQSR